MMTTNLHNQIEWGPWWLDEENLTLVHRDNEYDIPLSYCRTPAGLVRTIEHIKAKTWVTNCTLGHFVRAIADLHMTSVGPDEDFVGPHTEHIVKVLRTQPEVRVKSAHDLLAEAAERARGGYDFMPHGPWRYEEENDWFHMHGHAWGFNLSQVEKRADLVDMTDHLEMKSFCTPELLGQFWIAVRYWLRKRSNYGETE